MDAAPIQQQLDLINQLWESPGAEEVAPDSFSLVSIHWHGYGWRQENDHFVISPFVTSADKLALIEDRITRLVSATSDADKIRVEGLVAPFFSEIPEGDHGVMSNPLQPGNVVGVQGCHCPGTIGGFLTAQRDGEEHESTWLLSNHHVLAECGTNVQVLGADHGVIGTEVIPVPLKLQDNAVDAAVVRVNNPAGIKAVYEGLGPVKEPDPRVLSQLRNGTEVSKLGIRTGVTSGEVFLHCPRVKVSDCTDDTRRVFQHQLAIISTGELFADNTDSGSLVVAGLDPIGLLFARTSETTETIPTTQRFQPPFFLANRWDLLTRELSKAMQARSLSLMLERGTAAPLEPVAQAVTAPASG
ncbi:MAG TPA: hypothetical protein VH024_09850 [Candidatus Angelobacter sp.]|jgi:hypothetical protein|nr:hypothetical protein [Candidatus Angelobacter sp.]